MMIQVFDDTLSLSKMAATRFIDAAREAVQARGRFTVALTGGSSPLHMYQLLAQSPNREAVPWGQVHIFWGDERGVPLTDERSNAKMAFDNLLDAVPIPRDQIHTMWDSAKTPDANARRYEALLREYFQPEEPSFDLVLLGLGDDGHVASMFPGTDVLQEQERWVEAYYLEEQEMYRITLTTPVLNAARKVLFLTFGEKKAKALQQVLEGPYNPEQYPAQLIKPGQGKLEWLVGKAAASRLSGRKE